MKAKYYLTESNYFLCPEFMYIPFVANVEVYYV